MLEDRTVYVNGDFVPWGEARIHMMSHSFSRGSSIFEVLSLHEIKEGPAVFRVDEHLLRFFNSAELLSMELPLSGPALQNAIFNTVKHNGVNKGMIKIMAYYPQIAFEILPPKNKLDVAIFVVDPSQDVEGMAFPFDQGTTVGISKWRKLDPQSVPIEAKAAANYLNGMVARVEVQKRGFKDVVMLDSQGFIAEGGTESVFLVNHGNLLTPALGTVLGSITRKSILQLAVDMGIEIVEGRIPKTLLYEADEMFLSGTPIKVLPVRQVEDRIFESVPGSVTQRLSSRMKDIVSGRDDRFKEWLFPCR